MANFTIQMPLANLRINATTVPIQQNFQAISEWVNIDHMDFNAPTTQGKHKLLHFPQVQAVTPIPAPAVQEMTVFTKISAFSNVAAMFMQGNVATPGGGVPVEFTTTQNTGGGVGSHGWTRLPSGLIIKWGTEQTAAVGVGFPVTVTFNVGEPAFSLTPFAAFAVSNGGAPAYFSIGTLTIPDMVIQSLTANAPFYWLAIGV